MDLREGGERERGRGGEREKRREGGREGGRRNVSLNFKSSLYISLVRDCKGTQKFKWSNF